jgi:hypothetical protein
MPETWRNALEGQPAFICGAGPSLNVSIDCVAAHHGNAIVLAADSALRALAQRGVRADFAVSIDAAKIPEKCLPPDSDHLPLCVMLSAVSPPAWLAHAAATKTFFLSSNQLTLDWLATQGVARTALAASENCGSTALDLARFLGCAPIYLFGLDLALDAANPAVRHHAGVDASIYTESGFDAAQQHPTVPGNYAERVPTFAPTDWRALDQRLAGWPAGLVFNVNDRGARFRNTTLVHPRHFSFAGATHPAKVVPLARLAASEASSAPTQACERIRAIGERALREVAPLRSALAAQGPSGAVMQFRRWIADKDSAQAFGAFSLKLMPHLLPPTEGNAAFWSALIDEFSALAEIAAAAK